MDTTVYKLDKCGGSQVSSLDDVSSDGLFWVKTTIDQVESILSALGITMAIVPRVLTAKETRPRTLVYSDTLIATFRCAKTDKDDEVEGMVSVRLYMKENLIISVQRRKVDPIQEIEDSLQDGCGVKSSTAFLEKLLSLATGDMLDVISGLGSNLDEFEDTLMTQGNQSDREELGAIRRRIILLSRYISPQREAIGRVVAENISWFHDIDFVNMREITDSCTRLLENIRNEEERARVIYDECYAYAQERLNQKMYLLTIIASIFMPLTFITGLLGINVGGIPAATYKHGFLAVCLVLAAILVVQIIWLKKNKWFRPFKWQMQHAR